MWSIYKFESINLFISYRLWQEYQSMGLQLCQSGVLSNISDGFADSLIDRSIVIHFAHWFNLSTLCPSLSRIVPSSSSSSTCRHVAAISDNYVISPVFFILQYMSHDCPTNKLSYNVHGCMVLPLILKSLIITPTISQISAALLLIMEWWLVTTSLPMPRQIPCLTPRHSLHLGNTT